MHRIDNSTAAAVQPNIVAPGSPGFWTSGNPVGGTAATIMDQDWFNAMQEEPIALMAAAGIAPVKGTNTQVRDAVRRIAGGNAIFLTASAMLTPDHAGVVVVSATSGNRILTLPGAADAGGAPLRYEFVRTDASANSVTAQRAGSDTIEGVASITIPIGMRVTLVSDGATGWYVLSEAAPARGANWMRLPGGIIHQWGVASTASGGFIGVTFPIAFPAALLGIIVAPNSASFWSGGSFTVAASSDEGLTSFGIRYVNYVAPSFVQTSSLSAYWLAIGK